MKGQIIKILIGLASLLIMGFVVYSIYNLDNVNLKYKIGDKNELEVINLGSSHGDSFFYEMLNINGKRFNSPGNSIYYDLQVYKKIQNKLNTGCLVIIPISFFSFGVNENRTDQNKDNFENKYYHLLPPVSIYNYKLSKHMDLISQTTRENIPKILNREEIKFKILNKKKAFTIDMLKRMYADSYIRKKQVNFVKSGKQRSFYHQKSVDSVNIEKNIAYLTELISMVEQNSHIPILVTTPFHNEYIKNFSEEWLDDFFYKNVKITIENTGIDYLDYSKDSIIENYQFFDEDHLSSVGRFIFSKNFFNDVYNNKIINNPINGIREINSFKNFKMTEDLILKSIEIFPVDKKIFFILTFNDSIKEYINDKFAFHLVDEQGKILINSDIIKIQNQLNNNSIIREIDCNKLEVTNKDLKVQFNFYNSKNNKNIRIGNRVTLQLKDILWH